MLDTFVPFLECHDLVCAGCREWSGLDSRTSRRARSDFRFEEASTQRFPDGALTGRSAPHRDDPPGPGKGDRPRGPAQGEEGKKDKGGAEEKAGGGGQDKEEVRLRVTKELRSETTPPTRDETARRRHGKCGRPRGMRDSTGAVLRLGPTGVRGTVTESSRWSVYRGTGRVSGVKTTGR